MKIKTPQISWHSREPIYSVDFHKSGRIATAGSESDVKIWQYDPDAPEQITFLASLNRHVKAVNVVRFSPNGEYLATGSDDTWVIIWQHNPNGVPSKPFGTDEEDYVEDKEVWTALTILRGHGSDVYDLSWSADSKHLLSGSTDNTSILWHIPSGKEVQRMRDHGNYVQGVAYDPRGVYLASQSSDRTLKVYTSKKDKQKKKENGEFHMLHSVNKREYDQAKPPTTAATTEENPAQATKQKMFGDENVNTFFRRLSWTPDGSMLIVPTGLYQSSATAPVQNSTYIFTRNSLGKPVAHLPAGNKPTICVKSNPFLYKKRSKESIFQLEHRMIFAVASLDSIFLYDTETFYPIAYVDGIHYAELTDLSWSNDGNTLLVSSKDGYCTLITFDANELGERVQNV